MILVRRSQQHSLVINDSGLLPFKLIEMCMTCKSLATFLCLSFLWLNPAECDRISCSHFPHNFILCFFSVQTAWWLTDDAGGTGIGYGVWLCTYCFLFAYHHCHSYRCALSLL